VWRYCCESSENQRNVVRRWKGGVFAKEEKFGFVVRMGEGAMFRLRVLLLT
jgi:hypothetical protein